MSISSSKSTSLIEILASLLSFIVFTILSFMRSKVCSMNQGNYADHSGTTKVQNAIDQLEAIKRDGYSLVDIYHELEKLEK